MDIPVF